MSTSTTHRHLQTRQSLSRPVDSNNSNIPQLPYERKAQQLDYCADLALDDTKTCQTAATHHLLWQSTAQVRHLRRASLCDELETRARRGLGQDLLSLAKVTCLRRHNQTPRRRRNPSEVEDSVAVSVLTPATLEDASLGVVCQRGPQCGLNCHPQTVMTPGNRWISLAVTMLHQTTSLHRVALHLDSLQERSPSTRAADKACRPAVFAGMVRALLMYQRKTNPTFDMK